jgi:quinol monooxygenase YgiN
MTVKILIKRKFKNANSKHVSAVIGQSRKNAMREEGYISSETLCNCDDPNLIVVLSMWRNKAAWDNYKNSSARKEIEEKYSELFERPTEYESFDLGLSFAMSENDFVEPLEF